jgi:nitrate reductase gamma subunit
MDLGIATLVVGGGIGLLLAAFGLKTLISGRAPTPTARAFRTIKDAGLYYLLFGVALIMLALGTSLRGVSAGGSAVVAVVLVAVAVVKYRPRGREKAEQEKAEREKQ